MNKAESHNMWVHIEHDGSSVCPVSLELCCEIRKLCDQSGDKLFAVIPGELDAAACKQILSCGVDGLIRVSGSGLFPYNTDAYTNLYDKLCREYRPAAVFVGSTVNGRDFAPRFAARLETGCTSDATELVYNPDTGDLEFIEPAAGGKIMAVITIPEHRPQVATIRPGSFRYLPTGEKSDVEILDVTVDFDVSRIRTWHVALKPDAFDPMLNIADCETIVCVGSPVNAESLPLYRELAERLGGKLAGTRPVIDRELLPYKLQVGQSGVTVKPRLYLAFGVSGAINHITGVHAETVVAVNTDPGAPIFHYCDYGIVGDMDTVCRTMLDRLRSGA